MQDEKVLEMDGKGSRTSLNGFHTLELYPENALRIIRFMHIYICLAAV